MWRLDAIGLARFVSFHVEIRSKATAGLSDWMVLNRRTVCTLVSKMMPHSAAVSRVLGLTGYHGFVHAFLDWPGTIAHALERFGGAFSSSSGANQLPASLARADLHAHWSKRKAGMQSNDLSGHLFFVRFEIKTLVQIGAKNNCLMYAFFAVVWISKANPTNCRSRPLDVLLNRTERTVYDVPYEDTKAYWNWNCFCFEGEWSRILADWTPRAIESSWIFWNACNYHHHFSCLNVIIPWIFCAILLICIDLYLYFSEQFGLVIQEMRDSPTACKSSCVWGMRKDRQLFIVPLEFRQEFLLREACGVLVGQQCFSHCEMFWCFARCCWTVAWQKVVVNACWKWHLNSFICLSAGKRSCAMQGGTSVSGHRVLKQSTVSSLTTDWLRLKKACKTRNPPGWGSPDAPWLQQFQSVLFNRIEGSITVCATSWASLS